VRQAECPSSAVARPLANKSLFERQGSLRMPSSQMSAAGQAKTSSFQRYSSLRMPDMPASLQHYHGDRASFATNGSTGKTAFERDVSATASAFQPTTPFRRRAARRSARSSRCVTPTEPKRYRQATRSLFPSRVLPTTATRGLKMRQSGRFTVFRFYQIHSFETKKLAVVASL